MAYKSTRQKTGTNSYETVTHNRKTGEIRRTQTVKLPEGTRSSSSSNKRPGVRISTTRKVGGGYTQKTSYSTVKKRKKSPANRSHKSKGSGLSFKTIFFLFLFLITVLFFA